MALVYRHRDNRNRVFYVGVSGNKDRAYDYRRRSRFWKYYSEKYGVNTEIIVSDIPYKEAKELEILLISEYGRRDLGTGTLVNLTRGGDGVVGNKLSESSKNKIRKANIGKKASDETKMKISRALRGSKNPASVKLYDTETKKTYSTMKDASVDLGLKYSTLSAMINGYCKNKTNLIKIK